MAAYDVIEADGIEVFLARVRAALADGWQLQGGVAISQTTESWENERKGFEEHQVRTRYAQAVVKHAGPSA